MRKQAPRRHTSRQSMRYRGLRGKHNNTRKEVGPSSLGMPVLHVNRLSEVPHYLPYSDHLVPRHHKTSTDYLTLP